MRRLGLPKLLVLGAIAALALYMVGGARAGGAHVTQSSGQTMSASNAVNVLTWNTETFDTDAYHDNSTDPTRLTVPADGVYVITGGAKIESIGSTRYATLRVRKNGSTFLAPGFQANPDASTNLGLGVTVIDSATAGAYYELIVTQSDTSTRTLAVAETAFAIADQPTGGGGGGTAWGDITDKPTFSLSWLEDADTTGAIDGAVLKYDEAASEWQVATDNAGGEGSSGPVTLSAGDRERLDLAWWGVWALVGLALLALIAPAMYRLLDVRHGLGGRFERG